MKKIFVLLMVLCMATAANALIIDAPAEILEGDTGTIYIVADSADAAAGNWTGYLLVEPGTAGVLSNAVIHPATGDPGLAQATPYSEPGWGVGYEMLTGGTASHPLGTGNLFSFDLTGGLNGETTALELWWYGWGELINTAVINWVPESTTMLLLGLGGLFLLHRRK